MMTFSFRFPDDVAQKLFKWAKMDKKKDKSTAARELVEYGWIFVLLERYREGRMSLGSLAQELDLSLSETMDFLTRHGLRSPLDYSDYLSSLENVRKVF